MTAAELKVALLAKLPHLAVNAYDAGGNLLTVLDGNTRVRFWTTEGSVSLMSVIGDPAPLCDLRKVLAILQAAVDADDASAT